MNNVKILFVIISGIFFMTSNAKAAELTTPAMPFSLNGQRDLWCVATNVGNSPQDVLIQGLDYNGGIVGQITVTIDPNKTAHLALQPDRWMICKFIFSGRARDIRGVAHVADSLGDTISALAAY